MNNKVIFLDVDGTLCNDEGFVPESAKEAVRSARKNGHKVYLCTGRSKAEIYDFIMVIENISFILNNFIKNSFSEYIIFNWVIQTDEIMNLVLDSLKLKGVDVHKITLMCSEEKLIERIARDISKGIRDSESIKRSVDNLRLYERMETLKINTDNKSVETIIEEIKKIIR
ncbi:MAG: hypothetical protein PWP67_2733 [Clostridium butyricum]|nr:hypothetical protein [Clostridium butyricum]